jgi:hypothetical protein
MGQPAGLKRLSFMLRVKGSIVKRYYRVCDSSMIQAGWDFSYTFLAKRFCCAPLKFRKLLTVNGEPAGTRTQDPRLKSSKRPKYQWLDFAKVSPFFLCEQGLEMILYIPLIL